MKTLPLPYRAAIAAIRAAKLAPDYEYRSDVLCVYCFAAPAHRDDLRGKLYLEAFEKIPGGVTFLNWWAPATPAGFQEFFTGLVERTDAFLSPRPYQVAQACDGTINDCVLAAFKHACDALGFDADALYKKAYPERDDSPPEWARCREFADWQGGVALPLTWDNAALAGLGESLHETNYHSLAGEFADAGQSAGRSFRRRFEPQRVMLKGWAKARPDATGLRYPAPSANAVPVPPSFRAHFSRPP